MLFPDGRASFPSHPGDTVPVSPTPKAPSHRAGIACSPPPRSGARAPETGTWAAGPAQLCRCCVPRLLALHYHLAFRKHKNNSSINNRVIYESRHEKSVSRPGQLVVQMLHIRLIIGRASCRERKGWPCVPLMAGTGEMGPKGAS